MTKCKVGSVVSRTVIEITPGKYTTIARSLRNTWPMMGHRPGLLPSIGPALSWCFVWRYRYHGIYWCFSRARFVIWLRPVCRFTLPSLYIIRLTSHIYSYFPPLSVALKAVHSAQCRPFTNQSLKRQVECSPPPPPPTTTMISSGDLRASLPNKESINRTSHLIIATRKAILLEDLQTMLVVYNSEYI